MHFFSLFLFVNQPPRSFVAHVYLNVSNIPIPNIMDSRISTGSCKIWHLIRRGGCWSDGKWSRTTNPPSWGAGITETVKQPNGIHEVKKKVLDLHFCKKMTLHLSYEAGRPGQSEQSQTTSDQVELSWAVFKLVLHSIKLVA